MATAAAAASRLLLADGELKGHVLRLGEWLGRGDQSPRETEVKGEETKATCGCTPMPSGGRCGIGPAGGSLSKQASALKQGSSQPAPATMAAPSTH